MDLTVCENESPTIKTQGMSTVKRRLKINETKKKTKTMQK